MNPDKFVVRLSIVLLVALSSVIISCSKTDTDGQDTTATTTEVTTTVEQTTESSDNSETTTEDIAKDSNWSKDYK
ncbi:MAG: hypothetical protein GX303_04620 [Clostridiales bacterium]|nr:hypothetical protein [Clostridiales bacterium]